MASESVCSISSRIQGAIIGVCVCDALGGPVQFRKRGSFPPVTGFRYNPNFDQPAGAWSDDGSMTLCLAQSLANNHGKFDIQDVVSKFVHWYEDGYMSSDKEAWDVGIGTGSALVIWNYALAGAGVLDISETQLLIDEKLKRENYSGNGSLMRVAPVGCVFFQNPSVATSIARKQSDLTHPFQTNGEACAIYTSLICDIMTDCSKEELAQKLNRYNISNETLKGRLSSYTDISVWRSTSEDNIRSSGWVVDTLEAALWTFFTTNDFNEGALRVVNLGDDADTVGAVYGGLAGAYYGREAISIDWVKGLVKSELVVKIAEDLAQSAV